MLFLDICLSVPNVPTCHGCIGVTKQCHKRKLVTAVTEEADGEGVTEGVRRTPGMVDPCRFADFMNYLLNAGS